MVKRLGLKDLSADLKWAVMTLPTPGGTLATWSIIVAYSEMSLFPENTLCMTHALIKMADINTGHQDASRPWIRMNDKAYKLSTRLNRRSGAEELLLRLPLQEVACSAERLGRTSFLPDSHSMLYAATNRARGVLMMQRAELNRGHFDDFIGRHQEEENYYAPWLLGDLMASRDTSTCHS